MKFDRMVDKLLASKNQKEYQRNYEPVVKAYGTYKTFSDLINRIKALPKNNETPSSNGVFTESYYDNMKNLKSSNDNIKKQNAHMCSPILTRPSLFLKKLRPQA